MDLHQFDAYRHRTSTETGEMSYLDVGVGPVALFVHGLGTNALLWRNVIGAVGPQRRCVALDLPLHGRTPAAPGQDFTLPALAAVVEGLRAALDLGQVDLVANDTGGAVAQVYAAQHPQHLRTLTLIDCETEGNVPPAAFQPTVDAAAAGLLSAGAADLLADLSAARGLAFGSGYQDVENLPFDVVEAYLHPVLGTFERAQEFERFLLSIHDDDLRAVQPQLRRLTVPTLIVWGTDDPFFELSHAKSLADLIPGAAGVAEIDGGRLFLPDERAADLVPLLLDHWRRHP